MSFLAPLAERMRPKSLDEYIGQDHLLKEGASLRRALDSGLIPSMIFWGPPGVGKTTLAQLIATYLKRPIHTLSATIQEFFFSSSVSWFLPQPE